MKKALLLLLALTGCDLNARPGAWRPNGANGTNLRTMVAVPSDLAFAAPAGPVDGWLAAAAVARLRHDQVRPLLDSGVAQVVPVSGGSPPPAPVAPPAGTAANGP